MADGGKGVGPDEIYGVEADIFAPCALGAILNDTTLPQLKVLQEIITMCVFALFCVAYMKERISMDFLWAGLCLAGAAFFMFRHMQHLP